MERLFDQKDIIAQVAAFNETILNIFSNYDIDPVGMNKTLKSKITRKNVLYKKPNNPLLQEKAYWSIPKTFHNDNEIPLVSPFLVYYKIVTDIKVKENIFNEYFAEPCTP